LGPAASCGLRCPWPPADWGPWGGWHISFPKLIAVRPSALSLRPADSRPRPNDPAGRKRNMRRSSLISVAGRDYPDGARGGDRPAEPPPSIVARARAGAPPRKRSRPAHACARGSAAPCRRSAKMAPRSASSPQVRLPGTEGLHSDHGINTDAGPGRSRRALPRGPRNAGAVSAGALPGTGRRCPRRPTPRVLPWNWCSPAAEYKMHMAEVKRPLEPPSSPLPPC